MNKIAISFSLIFMGCICLSSCKKSTNDPSLFQTWRVSSMLKNGASIVQNASDTVLLTFNQDKNLGIKLEINSCGGTFSLVDKKLKISLVACTEACCDSDFSADMLYVLPNIDSYHFTGDDLNLTGDSDRVIRCVPY